MTDVEKALNNPLNALGLLCSAIRCGQAWDKHCDKARAFVLLKFIKWCLV